jgi:hemerythrin-like domain-containing protein
MKRHRSLHPLSQHHHFALIQALFIRRARQLPAARRAAAFRRQAEKFLHFWEQTGRQHFREEEEILLPAYARHAAIEDDADIVRMLAQHAAIRAQIERLRELLEESEPVEDHLSDLAALLQQHVRLEEDRIFPRIEKTLTEHEMQTLGHRLTRLHAKGSCDV